MIQQMIDFLKSLHQPETFATWLSSGGVILVTGIIFAETGLLLGFFLPGDSLLITAGVLSNPLNPNAVPGLSLIHLQIALTLAAIIGDQVGYYLGRKTGDAIFTKDDGFLFKKKHVKEAHAFYEKYGVGAIIACRYIPIFRTFVPFIAGVAKMDYRKYLQWDILGGFLWINSLLMVGYYLGQTSLANRLDKIIVLVIFVSILPVIVGGIRKWSMNSK
jgi:membrane-associated protein